MSETPIYYELVEKYGLTDRQIENKPEHETANPEKWDLENDDTPDNPPVWEGPTFDHVTVQPPIAQLEARPSLTDQNEAMSHSESVAYIKALGNTLVHNAREDVLKAA